MHPYKPDGMKNGIVDAVDMSAVDHYVANTECQELWKPENEQRQRSATDKAFGFTFCLITLLWLGIGFHAFQNYDGIPKELIDRVNNWLVENKIMEALSYSKGACFGFVSFSVLLIALFFVTLRWFTKTTICATLVLAGVHQLFGTYFVFLAPSFSQIFFMLMTWLVSGVVVYALRKIGLRATCKVLKDACESMICFPSSLLVVLLEFVLELGIIAFTLAAGVYLLNVKTENVWDYVGHDLRIPILRKRITANPPEYVAAFLLPILIGCAVWELCFVATFRRIWMHGMFSHWYRAADKRNISSRVNLRSCATVFRYHLGTVAFMSSIFAIIPVFVGYIKATTRRPRDLCASWIALWESLNNATVMCISHGTSACQSIKDGFQLAIQHPLKYVLSSVISHFLAIYGFLLVPLMTTFASYCYVTSQLNADVDPRFQEWFLAVPLIAVLSVSTFITTALILVFKTATEAVIVCFLEESSLSKTASQDEEYEV